ncbi:alpha/beta hydrolase [Pseudomonas vancouverensis]|uniref:Alpha/beta hydrolase n=1 Tax=Pseudomonas vancouverensis TaxID=95300 RepID=A0A1H2NFS1_PSEVA|nr:alpha/beta hydrolase [Pseudomonas vancouverensis]KAB0489343.1 alpha/beta hydrolase [Pseudomonas vancouverensis]TDB60959.1 alpha/beta hydrolase [Pseudomonas vancouverensis]SDV04319.1 acetyl esterase [Pseudomonas vancouverensis]
MEHSDKQETAPERQAIGMPRVLRAQQPDREARAFLRLVNLSTGLRAAEDYSLPRLRQAWRLTALALGRRPRVASVTEQQIAGPDGGIRLRIFKPEDGGQPLPAFIWCFGGGFIIGDLDTADGICRSLALAAQCIVIAVRYRLAPEHDLSAGRADALAALEWLAKEGARLGIDTTRLAIGGDSAGGNLSAAVAQESLRRGGPKLRLQVLVYPATELVEKFPSYAQNAFGHALLTDHAVQWMERTLAPSLRTLDLLDPWYSPRRNPDMRGLPPAVIVSAGFDPIRDDGLDYAARLRGADVPVELLHYRGQFHGFLNFDSVNGASRDALQRIGKALSTAFAEETPADRTIEIADRVRRRPSRLRASADDLATSTLTTWVVTERWGIALLRWLSPTAAGACRLLIRPWLLPTVMMRRKAISGLDRLIARQTYPTEKRCTVNP